MAVQEPTTVHPLPAQELQAKAITAVRDVPIAAPRVAVAVQAVLVVLELEHTHLLLVEPQVVAYRVPLRELQLSMQLVVQAIRTHDPTQKPTTIVALCGVPACVAVVHLCFVVLSGTARRHR